MSLMELDQTICSPRTVLSAPNLRKLRLSCDNCHAAKIKCTKERPACSRCDFGQFVAGRQQHWDLGQLEDNGELGSSTPRSRKTSLNTIYGENSSGGFGNLISSTPPKSPNLRTSLDFSSGQSALNYGGSSADDAILPPFNGELFGTMPGLMSGIMPACDALQFSTDDIFSPVSLNDIQCLDIRLNTKFDDSTVGIDSNFCHCSAALQETLGTLNIPSPPFDRLLAINKSAVNRVTRHLSCSCPPDISSIMLLFVIITKVVHWYKKSRDGQGSDEVGVTLGTFKVDKEDEHRMKVVLIKSELRKVEMLISRFRDRFERSLDGQDEQVYEANMAFLEQRLQDAIKGL
ncbi:hypothetical protein H2199_001899 [Coniosporium tulheliwenetii]|uniref:Uncharacterized protein n=1 Tax=Coniosporium tulheliwenetii TaxID=3383036 RepID=A0ACC2ZKQ1_9PEZI|nr:hypothetical protein H2199_001899 [Cladosporium sp. JES 115]